MFELVSPTRAAEPDQTNVEIYRELQALQDEMSASLREVFVKHREFVMKGG